MEKAGHALGPVLVMSYKNHALDEFLMDIVNEYQGSRWPGFLIRTGTPELEILKKFSERSSAGEHAAQDELCTRLGVQRQARRVAKDWIDLSRSLDTVSNSKAVVEESNQNATVSLHIIISIIILSILDHCSISD